MTDGRKDLPIIQGATFRRYIGYPDGVGGYADLTTYQARMKIRSDWDVDPPIAVLTTENGSITLYDGTGPEMSMELVISASATGAMSLDQFGEDGRGVYNLDIGIGGDWFRFLSGFVVFKLEATW